MRLLGGVQRSRWRHQADWQTQYEHTLQPVKVYGVYILNCSDVLAMQHIGDDWLEREYKIKRGNTLVAFHVMVEILITVGISGLSTICQPASLQARPAESQ